MKIGIGIVCALGILAWLILASPSVSVVDSTTQKHIVLDKPHSPVAQSPTQPQTPATNQASAGAHVQAEVAPKKSHLDHLSPEMKQAVKDTLFHHGPKTITKDNQGRIRMDHAGRYVNMPVAVRKADGSIEIKEYSVIPDAQTETAQ
jgi:hypothetical protein